MLSNIASINTLPGNSYCKPYLSQASRYVLEAKTDTHHEYYLITKPNYF